MLRSSILASFFQSMGYLSLAFLMTLYLQGVRGLSPLDSALLMVPGYILSSVLAPFMGSRADKYGARVIATIGIALMCVTVLIYLTSGRVDAIVYRRAGIALCRHRRVDVLAGKQ